MLCIGAGLVLVIVHLVLVSVNVGTALPGVFNGQWAIGYTQYVVQPLTVFFNNLFVNDVLLVVLWGIVGLGVYMIFEFIVHGIGEWREAQKDIQMAVNQSTNKVVVQHPMRKYFVTAALWRGAIIGLIIIYLVATQPLLQWVLAADLALVVGMPLVESITQAVTAIIIWAVFWHGCVVLLRLYTMRTRLFGDDILY